MARSFRAGSTLRDIWCNHLARPVRCLPWCCVMDFQVEELTLDILLELSLNYVIALPTKWVGLQ
jgi:hypothetical protein